MLPKVYICGCTRDTVKFFGHNSGKAQPIRTKAILQGNVDSGRTLAWKISASSVQRPRDGGEKPKSFLSRQQLVVLGTSRRPISLKFEHKTQIGVISRAFSQNCEILPIRGHLIRKTAIFGSLGYHSGHRDFNVPR